MLPMITSFCETSSFSGHLPEKLPKHILLCTTIRHLYHNKQLTTILNRLGHCETYEFGLELETSIAKALDEVSTNLTQQIITGKGNDVFHLEWDNLNKVTTIIYLYTLAVSPSLRGSRQHKRNKQKQWGFHSVLPAMTRDPAEFGWHCWSNTTHSPPSSTTYVAS